VVVKYGEGLFIFVWALHVIAKRAGSCRDWGRTDCG